VVVGKSVVGATVVASDVVVTIAVSVTGPVVVGAAESDVIGAVESDEVGFIFDVAVSGKVLVSVPLSVVTTAAPQPTTSGKISIIDMRVMIDRQRMGSSFFMSSYKYTRKFSVDYSRFIDLSMILVKCHV
jgi:hypothetical protein